MDEVNVNVESSPSQKIVVYGTTWCSHCFLVKRVLDSHGAAYDWIDIGEDAEAASYVQSVNRGYQSVPTIVFPDGRILTEPSSGHLASVLTELGYGAAASKP
jgi:mycoredoxin